MYVPLTRNQELKSAVFSSGERNRTANRHITNVLLYLIALLRKKKHPMAIGPLPHGRTIDATYVAAFHQNAPAIWDT